MIRINANIPVKSINDYDLITEFNEIPRVIELYNHRIHTGILFNDIPKSFTLENENIKFFLNKGKYLSNRYENIYKELTIRNILCKNNVNMFYQMKPEHFKDYEFTQKENLLVVTRMINIINESNKLPSFYGINVSKDVAINELLK